ncbi:hypothetical protein QT17_12155 [Thermus sp. 2.9]|uniref:hypothetical protein n=1 Tax=Thermus sp. (strain 2.9) TaxID=1577051 RepID=UPI0005424D89|nr:hypothetical protein [Thermus sp. 2.9]KHG64473.1 hypothetical protein QT17_12155 [Thermus sp. 2.9]
MAQEVLAWLAANWGVLAVPLAYALLVHAARVVGIAQPSWRLAKAQLEELSCRLELEEAGDAAKRERLKELLGKAREMLGERPPNLLCSGVWNGSREMGTWRILHRVERELSQLLEDEEVRARLERGLEELSLFPEEEAKGWRERMEAALGRQSGLAPLEEAMAKLQEVLQKLKEEAGNVAYRRALLAEFLGALYDRRDREYARLLTLHNKATLLLALALFLSGVLVLAWPGALWPWWWPSGPDPLFLYLGGLGGGLLSRLLKVVQAGSLPTDYGAYWVPLYLSPALGGLLALLGVLVFRLALEAGVLGPALRGLVEPPLAYGLAVLLGFSERLFPSLVQGLETRLAKEREGSGESATGGRA